MLNLLEPFELHRRNFLGPDHVHLLVQAKQLAYHDRDRVLADPRFVDGADRAAALDGLCRASARADGPRARAAVGPGAVVRQPGRRHGLRRRRRRGGQRGAR